MIQNFTCENLDYWYGYDVVSTEAESSDGSEQSFNYGTGQMNYGSSRKYKTQPCKNYSLSGYCTYGQKCQFAHGNFEINPSFCGNLYKTKQCKNFWKKGFCLYGIRCQFLHSECQQRPSKQNCTQYLKRNKHSYLDYTTQSRLLGIL